MRGVSLEDAVANAIVGLLGFSCSAVSRDDFIATPTFNVTPVVSVCIVIYSLVSTVNCSDLETLTEVRTAKL